MMTRKLCALAALILACGSMAARADCITVDIYEGFTDQGGGAPYSGLVGSFTTDDVMFATDTGYNWHPFGQGSFGADINGLLCVDQHGDYTFTLDSDDGSLLYIDGNLVIDNGGPHGPFAVSGTASLTAGVHTFNVQFFEDFGGPSGVDLILPDGVSYCCVPEPATMTLCGIGLAGLDVRRIRKRA